MDWKKFKQQFKDWFIGKEYSDFIKKLHEPVPVPPPAPKPPEPKPTEFGLRICSFIDHDYIKFIPPAITEHSGTSRSRISIYAQSYRYQVTDDQNLGIVLEFYYLSKHYDESGSRYVPTIYLDVEKHIQYEDLTSADSELLSFAFSRFLARRTEESNILRKQLQAKLQAEAVAKVMNYQRNPEGLSYAKE